MGRVLSEEGSSAGLNEEKLCDPFPIESRVRGG